MNEQSLSTPSTLLRHQMMRFAVVGSCSAIIDFGLLALLTEVFGVYYLVSATVAFVAANIFNFALNRRWTFNSADPNVARQYAIFVCVSVAGLLINTIVLYVGVEWFSLHYIISKVGATAVVMFWNFFMNKYVTFRHTGQHRPVESSAKPEAPSPDTTH